MGTNPKDIPADLLKRQGLAVVGGHVTKEVIGTVDGWFWLVLDIAPPTATHQAKEISYITSRKTGKRHATLLDSERLDAARGLYLRSIPDRAQYIALKPPVALWMLFFFPFTRTQLQELSRSMTPEALAEYEPRHVVKPDADNLSKTLIDCLAFRGFVKNDSHVSDPVPKKFQSVRPRIVIYGRSLRDAADDGGIEHFDPRDSTGSIYPTLYLTQQDVLVARRMNTAAASIEDLTSAERQRAKRARSKQRGPGSPRAKSVIFPRAAGNNGYHHSGGNR